MSSIDKLILHIQQMDEYQLELVISFISELFDLNLND